MPSSAPASAPSSTDAPGFEDFYLASRRRLLLETYALTGDLTAARNAVRDAFVSAGQHWRKVGGLSDPEEWVRPRAWAMAQRRHVARLWHREKGLTAEQKTVLDALHHLPDQQRKMLLLSRLAGLSVVEIGRELGETRLGVERQLADATAAYCRETGTDENGVLRSIGLLAPVAEAAALPRPELVRTSGRQRGRWHAVAGIAALVALTLLGGQFVATRSTPDPVVARDPGPPPTPVTEAQLLDLDQVSTLAPDERWQARETTDNTSGTGINSVCQTSRFADPAGEGTFVRRFAALSTPRRSYVQTVEISSDPQTAAAAYRTTLGWFAGCDEARLQLLNAYRVTGLGERAQMLKLRIPGEVRRTYLVGLARSGSLTISTVLETVNGEAVAVTRAAGVLTAAVRNLCDREAAGACPSDVRVDPVLPPPSGETPGTLAAGDLPVIGSINRPWVGTRPLPARPNVAATSCDRTNFVRLGAPRARTRTFLVPEARLPRRFGITETVGAFRTPARAKAVVARVNKLMASCERRDPGAEVSNALVEPEGYRGSEYSLWRLDSEIAARSSVGFWMGVARVGRYVAQVTFTPVGANDLDADVFQALITRARDRLFELVPRR